MKKLISAALLVATMAGAAGAGAGEVRLTLKDAIKMAAEKNLDVKAELYNPASAEADVRRNYGIYDTILSVFAGYQNSTTLPASTLLSGADTSKSQYFKLNPGASRLLPLGGTVGLVFDNTYNTNNSDTARGFMGKYWQSDLTLSFTQPLLQNYGREVTELNIDVAKFGKEEALEQFKNRLNDIISQVSTQYFQLRYLRENLEVKKTSLALAEKILSETRARIKAGVLPAMEELNALFGVSTRQKELIDAERALNDQNDALQLLLQLPGNEAIVPVDNLYSDRYQADEAIEIQRALDNRPDLKQLQVTVKSNELQERVARNQTLPSLNLTANAALTGLADAYGRDLERVGTAKYPIWGAGLQLTYPLENNAARNGHIKSRLKVEQSQTQVRSLVVNIANEVKAAVRGVQSSYIQLDVTAKGSAYAGERLNAFIKKNQVGLATTKDVIDVQNDLVTAKGNAIKALSDYNSAITQLWKATGELLTREGITFSEKEADALYGKFR